MRCFVACNTAGAHENEQRNRSCENERESWRLSASDSVSKNRLAVATLHVNPGFK